MKIFKKRHLAFMICLLFVLPAIGMAKPINIKFGTNQALKHSSYQGYLKFKELVEKRSNGQITITLYPKGQLGTSPQQLQGVRMGTQDMYAEAPGYLTKEGINEYRVVNLLYFFRDEMHMRKFLSSPLGDQMAQKVIDKLGIRILNNKYNFVKTPRGIAAKKPILTIDDIQGLKMRMFSNKVAIDSWKHMGVDPIVIPWHDAYMALRQGTVEAITASISAIRAMKFMEVLSYVTLLKQYWQIEMLWINEKKFQSFSKEQQQILIDSANDAGDYVASTIKEKYEEDIQYMINNQNATIIYLNTKPFRDKMQPHIQKLVESGYISKEVYETCQAIK